MTEGNKQRIERFVTATSIVMYLMLAWLIASLALSLLANGWLYHIDSPAEVTVRDDHIVVNVMRRSLVSMQGHCVTELICNVEHDYPSYDCPIEAGTQTLRPVYPVPSYPVEGPCYLSGVVRYQPAGTLGPMLTHNWTSETFTIE